MPGQSMVSGSSGCLPRSSDRHLTVVVGVSRCVSCCAVVTPCIAVVTDIWRTEAGRSQRFTEPLAPPDLRWLAVFGAGPARGGRSLVVDGLAHPQPAGSGGSRGDPADLGVSPWTVAELRCLRSEERRGGEAARS